MSDLPADPVPEVTCSVGAAPSCSDLETECKTYPSLRAFAYVHRWNELIHWNSAVEEGLYEQNDMDEEGKCE